MTDWRSLVREAVADAERERLSDSDAQAMRRSVLEAVEVGAGRRAGPVWLNPLVLATSVAAMIGAGVIAGLRLESSAPAAPAAGRVTSEADEAVAAPQPEFPVNRQLQFLTPGGTRIIWVFNSELDLKATMR